MKGIIDIPYELIKEAVERIEKKKGTCKFLPNARFKWQYSRNNYGHIQVGESMPNLYGSDERSFIDIDCLVCDGVKMGGKNTGTAAEHCRNCIIYSCKHEHTKKEKCKSKECPKFGKYHSRCLDCGALVDLL